MNIECRKVQALMSLYIDDALSEKLKKYVYEHLLKCKLCMQKYLELKKTMQFLKEHFITLSSKIPAKPIFNVHEEEKFKISVSAYIDNELMGKDALKFKQYLGKYSHAKKFLKEYKTTNNYIKKFFKKNTPELRNDLSKKVIKEIKEKKYITTPNIRDIIITLILAIFTVITFFAIEKIIFPNHIQDKKEKITFSKLLKNINSANTKNFFY